ncbi:hypothetical protein AVEN_103525-1 [Araneus ventricosus]|uniref:Uncharacterized protein n=1 Tax=Araneus ventricosus TaxID=182803 RepID=A0A4Y2Q606_ARAVE|nr:hypothetical protein AVEN_103525-1 [Araneus ventricosus]
MPRVPSCPGAWVRSVAPVVLGMVRTESLNEPKGGGMPFFRILSERGHRGANLGDEAGHSLLPALFYALCPPPSCGKQVGRTGRERKNN